MIDFRSDTLTSPSKSMLNAIVKAKVGDDGRAGTDGRGEDATVNELEDAGARIFGKETALFVPSGTMGNLVSLMSHTDYGDNIGVNEKLHVYRSEKGVFVSRPGGLKAEFYKSDEFGKPDMEELEKFVREKSVKLLCIENTHNFAGGTCMTKEEIDEICDICHENGVSVHLDGARIFNASAYLGIDVGKLCSKIDSVMSCLSKGLGAPVGSLILGSSDFIREARRNRKLVGGGMRQAGVIAAAGLVALEEGPKQVAEDNKNARKIADAIISEQGALKIDHRLVQTNILRVDIADTGFDSQKVCADLLPMGIKVSPLTETSFRLVTYNGIGDAEVDKAIEILTGYSGSFKK